MYVGQDCGCLHERYRSTYLYHSSHANNCQHKPKELTPTLLMACLNSVAPLWTTNLNSSDITSQSNLVKLLVFLLCIRLHQEKCYIHWWGCWFISCKDHFVLNKGGRRAVYARTFSTQLMWILWHLLEKWADRGGLSMLGPFLHTIQWIFGQRSSSRFKEEAALVLLLIFQVTSVWPYFWLLSGSIANRAFTFCWRDWNEG